MNEKLKQAAKAWAIHKDYERNMPEVEYKKRYRKETGLYPWRTHDYPLSFFGNAF